MGQPKVSIIIPAYNREKTLPRAIDSVLAQTYENWELLIVDDCSIDNTIELISQKYDDARIKIIKMPQNGGANRARNKGIQESNSEYILFLDSDDEINRQLIERQLHQLEITNAKACYTGADYYINGKYSNTVHPQREGNLEYFLFLNLKGLGASNSGFMIKKELLSKAGTWDNEFTNQDDLDFFVRIARYFDICYVEGCNSKIHIDTSNRISDNRAYVIHGEELFLKKHEKRIKELGLYHYVARKLARKYALHGNSLRKAYNTLFLAIKYRPWYLYAYLYILKLPILYLKKKK